MSNVDYGIAIPFIPAETTETSGRANDVDFVLVKAPSKVTASFFEAPCPAGLVDVCSPSGTDDIVWRYAG